MHDIYSQIYYKDKSFKPYITHHTNELLIMSYLIT